MSWDKPWWKSKGELAILGENESGEALWLFDCKEIEMETRCGS